MSSLKILIIIVVLAILISCVAFFTSAETAFLSLNRFKVRRMLEERRKNAGTVAKLKNQMDSLLTTVLIGTNFLNSLASSLGTMLAVGILGESGVGIATLIVAFFITTFGQIIPKTLAGLNPEKVAARGAPVLALLKKIFFPIVFIFTGLSHGVVWIFEKLSKPVNATMTEEEIQTLIDVGETEGTIEKSERVMLTKIFQFSDLDVKDIMRHRSLVAMVEESDTEEKIVETFMESGYSNLVVYKENTENVTGIIPYKAVVFSNYKLSAKTEKSQGRTAASFMEKPFFVPGSLSVFELLEKFRGQNRTFAVVLDEQGGTLGVVTMKDVMKVVFGRMSDENSEDTKPEDRIKVISPRELILPGDLKLEEVNSLLKLNLESDFYNTLGGWVLEQYGSLPKTGDIMIKEKTLYIMEEVINRRIMSVRIKIR